MATDDEEPTTALTARRSTELAVEPHRPPYRSAAAGLPAVVSSLAYTVQKAGPIRGTRVLLRVKPDERLRLPELCVARPEAPLHRRVLRERRARGRA